MQAGGVRKSEGWSGSLQGFTARGFSFAIAPCRRMVHRLQGQAPSAVRTGFQDHEACPCSCLASMFRHHPPRRPPSPHRPLAGIAREDGAGERSGDILAHPLGRPPGSSLRPQSVIAAGTSGRVSQARSPPPPSGPRSAPARRPCGAEAFHSYPRRAVMPCSAALWERISHDLQPAS